ncbi:amidohydrolase family protein [Natrarchaeobius sp. A-rgal3]|uniref:amidohydrolase family protein n=1 Tax=Natrarchaeobius versutus TaxID=1679078 RepID=UPI003510A7C8
MSDLLIDNVRVITMAQDETCPNYIEDGAILIEGDSIVTVADRASVTGDVDRVVDGDRNLALPGMLNGHNHFEQSFMKASVRLYEGTTAEWIQNYKIPLTNEMTREDYYLSHMLTCIDLIRSGVTCSVNHVCQQHPDKLREFGLEEGMRAIRKAGIRSVVPIGLAGKNEPDDFVVPADVYESFLRDTMEKWHESADGRIRVWPGPTGFYSATEPMWETAKAISEEWETGIHTHIATFEDGDIQRATERDLLGPNFVGAHCVWLSERDVVEMADGEMKVVHNPTYKLGYSVDSTVEEFGDGIAPIADMADHGCTVGLGQDGCMGDTQDMFKEMRALGLTQQYRYRDKALFPPTKLLEMATIDCAKTMLWDDEIGSLEPGKKADVVLLDLSESKFTPLQNLPANVVYQANAENVSTVFIDGQVVLDDRTVTTVDEGKLLGRAQDAAEALFERAGLDDLVDKGFDPWNSSCRHTSP